MRRSNMTNYLPAILTVLALALATPIGGGCFKDFGLDDVREASDADVGDEVDETVEGVSCSGVGELCRDGDPTTAFDLCRENHICRGDPRICQTRAECELLPGDYQNCAELSGADAVREPLCELEPAIATGCADGEHKEGHCVAGVCQALYYPAQACHGAWVHQLAVVLKVDDPSLPTLAMTLDGHAGDSGAQETFDVDEPRRSDASVWPDVFEDSSLIWNSVAGGFAALQLGARTYVGFSHWGEALTITADLERREVALAIPMSARDAGSHLNGEKRLIALLPDASGERLQTYIGNVTFDDDCIVEAGSTPYPAPADSALETWLGDEGHPTSFMVTQAVAATGTHDGVAFASDDGSRASCLTEVDPALHVYELVVHGNAQHPAFTETWRGAMSGSFYTAVFTRTDPSDANKILPGVVILTSVSDIVDSTLGGQWAGVMMGPSAPGGVSDEEVHLQSLEFPIRCPEPLAENVFAGRVFDGADSDDLEFADFGWPVGDSSRYSDSVRFGGRAQARFGTFAGHYLFAWDVAYTDQVDPKLKEFVPRDGSLSILVRTAVGHAALLDGPCPPPR